MSGATGRRPAALTLLVTTTVWDSTFVVTETVLDEAGPFAVSGDRPDLKI